jgi:hypothetical protein
MGEGEGEGGGSGSGSGGGGASGSGSGSGECSGSGSGCGGVSGSGSGTGEGSGSGSGTGEGSGSGSGEASGSGAGEGSGSGGVDQPPEVAADFTAENNKVIISGWVTNDGTVGGLTVSFEGLYVGTITTNEDGYFCIEIDAPQSQGTISYSVTDDHGLVSQVELWEYVG